MRHCRPRLSSPKSPSPSGPQAYPSETQLREFEALIPQSVREQIKKAADLAARHIVSQERARKEEQIANGPKHLRPISLAPPPPQLPAHGTQKSEVRYPPQVQRREEPKEVRPGPDIHQEDQPQKKRAIEVFCGCARLTAELEKAGFSATGIDFQNNKDRSEGKCIWLDISSSKGRKAFWDLVRSSAKDGTVVYVHFGPPCGTASAARNIRRFDKKGRPSKIDPKPLRSTRHPDGLPYLKGRDLQRVKAANELYRFTAMAIKWLEAEGVCR